MPGSMRAPYWQRNRDRTSAKTCTPEFVFHFARQPVHHAEQFPLTDVHILSDAPSVVLNVAANISGGERGMSIAGETSREEATSGQEWMTHTGINAVLHVRRGSRVILHVQQYLRQCELLIDSLKKQFGPADARSAPIQIYIDDEIDTETSRSEDGPTGAAQAAADRGALEDAPTIGLESSELSVVTLAKRLTGCLVLQWYGRHASEASVFIDGIAGIVAASSGLAEGITEADRWVSDELEAGRVVSVSASMAEDVAGPETAGRERFDSAAVSFTAFLLAQFGPAAVREYLASYDPNRSDYAAITAYHRPLAVLREEWLARLHRRRHDGVMLRSFLRRIVPLLAPYKWKQVEILFYLLLAAAYNIVQPYAIKIVIDRLTKEVRVHPGGAASSQVFTQILAPFLLLLLAIYVLNGVVSLRRAYTVSWLNQNVLNTLQVRMYSHLQRLGHNFYLNAKLGDIMARLNDDLDTVQSALSQVTNKALYQSFTVVGALTALLLLTRQSPLLAIPILCIVPLFAVSYAALRTRNKQASREQRRGIGQAMADVQQHLSAHAVIKAFGLEKRTIANYEARVKALQRSKLRLALLSALTDLSEETTTALAQLIIFGVGGFLVLRDGGRGLGVGDLSALLVLVKSIFSPIASLAGVGQTMQQATGAMERVTELFDEPVTIQDKPGAAPLPPLSQEIRLEGVTFRYGGKRPALRGVSLTIPAGAHVAIVGLSGGGKSSIVNLLLRFWDPEEGRVLFDGYDLRDVTLASVRSQIGLVFQETFIFDTTLRENIAVGKPEATDTEIANAAKSAQLEDLIRSLPEGYDTIPGENGARLSVGQKQRIAIARAFLRNPRILVLDEATSALDAQTEAGVLETLARLAEGRTTITVTHRIAQAANADLILVMDAGKLVEHGAHADLMRAGGLYRRLHDEAAGTAVQPHSSDCRAA
jgi:ABC-type multidrug transport system fused ATPase/permease subunit